MKHKALALITRHDQMEVLTFTHRDFPEAGVQVPAGTVSDGETPEAALWREVYEEAGLTRAQLQFVEALSVQVHPSWGEAGITEHLFHLSALTALPDTWTHVVQGDGEDVGYVFQYRWLPLQVPLARWYTRRPPWLERSEAW